MRGGRSLTGRQRAPVRLACNLLRLVPTLMHISQAISFATRGVSASAPNPAPPASPDFVMAPLHHSFLALSLQEPQRPRLEPAPPYARGLRIQIPLRNPQARTVLRFNDPDRVRDASPGARDTSPPARQRTPQPASPQTPDPRSTPADDWPTLADIGRSSQAQGDSPDSPPLIVREADILQLQQADTD